MITPEGYSNDKSIMPEGICVTWGKDLIQEKGGLVSFIRYFESVMANEDGIWLQKCKNKPKYDNLLYVYIIVCNRVAYRCFYAGHAGGTTNIYFGDGRSWHGSAIISWPRIILAGPFTKAPTRIIRSGFQGFRYCTKLF